MASISILSKRLNDYRIAIPNCSVSPTGLRSHIDAGSLIGNLPDDEDFLKVGALDKMNLDREWVTQQISVSSSTLYMTSTTSNDVKDLIPLKEVTEVSSLSQRKKVTSAPDEWRNLIAGDSDVHAFEVMTDPTGYNSGRAYIFSSDSEIVRDEWVRCIDSAAKESRIRAIKDRDSKFRLARIWVKKVYDSRPFQYLTALLIAANFLANVMQAEKNPSPGSPEQTSFDNVDFAFTGSKRIALNVMLCRAVKS